MDSEAVFHFVSISDVCHLLAEAKRTQMMPNNLERHVGSYAIRREIGRTALEVARGWATAHCQGDAVFWEQFGKDRLLVGQFSDPDDAIAFKLRWK